MTGSFQQAAAGSTDEVLSALDASVAQAKEVLNGLDDATVSYLWWQYRDAGTYSHDAKVVEQFPAVYGMRDGRFVEPVAARP